MSTTVKDTATRVSDILPKDWSAGDSFSADEVLNAYFKGVEEGQNTHQEKLKKEFSINVKLATSISEELLAIGIEKNLKLQTIHLKATAINSFEALFLVHKDSIISDDFRNAYVISRTLRDKYKNDKFNLSFSFIADTEDIDNNCLAADGFFMRYESKKAD